MTTSYFNWQIELQILWYLFWLGFRMVKNLVPENKAASSWSIQSHWLNGFESIQIFIKSILQLQTNTFSIH